MACHGSDGHCHCSCFTALPATRCRGPILLPTGRMRNSLVLASFLLLFNHQHKPVASLQIFGTVNRFVNVSMHSNGTQPLIKGPELRSGRPTFSSAANTRIKRDQYPHGSVSSAGIEKYWLYAVLPITVPIYIILWAAPHWFVSTFLPWLKTNLVGSWENPGFLLYLAISAKNQIKAADRLLAHVVDRSILFIVQVFDFFIGDLLHPLIRAIEIFIKLALQKLGCLLVELTDQARWALLLLQRSTVAAVRQIHEQLLTPLAQQSTRIVRITWKRAVVPAALLSRKLLRTLLRASVLAAKRAERQVLRPAALCAASIARRIYNHILLQVQAAVRSSRVAAAALHENLLSPMAAVANDAGRWTWRHLVRPTALPIYRAGCTYAATMARAIRAAHNQAVIPAVIAARQATAAAARVATSAMRAVHTRVLIVALAAARRIALASSRVVGASARALVRLALAGYRDLAIPAAQYAKHCAAAASAAARRGVRTAYRRALLPAAYAVARASSVAWRRAVLPAAAGTRKLCRTLRRELLMPAAQTTLRVVALLWAFLFGPSTGWVGRTYRASLEALRKAACPAAAAARRVLGPPARVVARAGTAAMRVALGALGALGRLLARAAVGIHRVAVEPALGVARMMLQTVVIPGAVAAHRAAADMLRATAGAVRSVQRAVVALATRAGGVGVSALVWAGGSVRDATETLRRHARAVLAWTTSAVRTARETVAGPASQAASEAARLIRAAFKQAAKAVKKARTEAEEIASTVRRLAVQASAKEKHFRAMLPTRQVREFLGSRELSRVFARDPLL